MDLMGTLGLDNVDDPDNLPDSKYRGVIKDAGYMISKTDKLGIFFVYKVNDPASKFNGREKFDWTTIGDGGFKGEDGEYGCKTPTMSETQKPYFKKRLGELGIPESRLANLTNADLKGRIGTDVIFGIKNKDGYNNVNFVEIVGAGAATGSSISEGVDPFKDSPAPTASPTTTTGTNLADQI